MIRIQSQFKTIYEITPEFIKSNHIKGLFVDMDNTLLPWDETVIGNESMQWVKAMQKAGIKICVITNSGSKRTDEVMKNTGLLYVPSAFKPFPFGFMRAQAKLKIQKKNICLIGDQMMTDALGSKIFGCSYILVDPLSPKEQKITYVNRFFERILFGRDIRKTTNGK